MTTTKTKKTEEKTSEVDKKSDELSQLLDKYDVIRPKEGELVTGEVIDIGKNAIYLDLGLLGTGIVLGREMKDGLGVADTLKKGDEIEATVLDIENEDGYMELSLREAGYEKTWKELKRKMEDNEIVSTKILAANRGGLMVEINGIVGFLPVSQLSNEHYPRVEDSDKNKILQLLKRFVDQNLEVRIIDLDQNEEKLIVSEKATQAEKEEKEINKFELGDVVIGNISGIVKFGAFVKFAPKGKDEKEVNAKNMLEGLVHISELAWQLIDNPHDIVKIGEKVKCKIIEIKRSKISLSIRALQEDPWSNVEEKYKPGDIVEGMITKLNPFGAFVQLDENIHGLAHISELNRFAQGKNIEEVIKPGENYKFKILSIESASHRMGLTPFIDGDPKKESFKKEENREQKQEQEKKTKKKEGEDKKDAKEQKDKKTKAKNKDERDEKKKTVKTNKKSNEKKKKQADIKKKSDKK